MNARAAALVALAAAVTSVALIAAGCSGDQQHADDDLSSALQRETDFVRTELHIPGVTAAVVLPDGTTWTGSSGYAIERQKRATPETLFAIGSVTKTFTAALVLRLVEEGVLRLDDPVGRWLPAYRGQPRLTIRNLLNHTSGIRELFENPRFYPAIMRNPRVRWDPDRTLKFVGTPNFAPGKGWRYSNTDYILLGSIIERATQQTVGDELHRLVLAPLGLDDVDLQDVAPPEGELSHGYEDQDIADRGTVGDVSDGTRYVPYTAMATVAWTAGGIAASALSVARFAHDLFGGKLLRPALLAEMTRFDARGDYGLGVSRVDSRGPTSFVGNHVVWGHNGATIGYRSVMWYAPRERIAVVVLVNSAASTEVLAERLLSVAVADVQRHSSGSSATEHDALVQVDAKTGERGTTIAMPATERAVASDGRVVWVYSQTSGTRKGKLTRIDARTGVPTGSFDASVPFATHLAAAGESVWLGRPAWDWNPGGGLGHIEGDRPRVWRLRPGRRVLEPAEFSGYGTGYENLAPVAAAGSLWVSCCLRGGALLRVDPATGRVLARIRSGEEVLAEGPGFVWASFRSWPPLATAPPLCARTCLRRIDTETNASAPIAAPRFVPGDFAFANGAIWASASEKDAIVRLDPATGKELGGRVDIGESPGALASANGALWVSLTGGSAVARYDLETGDVETIDVGGTPSDLAVAGDSIWVAVQR